MSGRRAGRVIGPGLGQVEGAVDESMPVPGHVGREYPDLAVRDLPGRARVLAPDPAGRLALLQKARLIENQNRIRISQGLERIVAHEIAQRIGVPARPIEKRLLAPRTSIARGLGAHPSRLAPLRPEQGVQEQLRRRRRALLLEQRPDPPLDVPQR
jgi:hypothetical protein